MCSNNLAAQDQTHPLLLQRRTSWCSLPFVLVLCGPPPHPLFALLSPQVPWGSDVPKNHGRSFLKPSPLHNHNRECLNFVASHSILYALFANILYISTFVVNNIPLCHLLSKFNRFSSELRYFKVFSPWSINKSYCSQHVKRIYKTSLCM